jgi:5-methylcytosine-specific restriction protein A
MQVDLKYVFFLPKSRSKPVLAIWTDGWTEEEIQRVRAMKPEVKKMAAAVGAKIYMTPIHPHEQEAREVIRRKSRGPKYRNRQSIKRAIEKDESEPSGPEFRTTSDIASKRSRFKHSRNKHYKWLAAVKGEVCVECGRRDDLTVDHIKSLSNGGTNDRSNLQLLCDPCNQAKSMEESKIFTATKQRLFKYDPDSESMVKREDDGSGDS